MVIRDCPICGSDEKLGELMAHIVFDRPEAILRVAEVFRELGYEGASLSRITERTKLSRGSLYHFFPGGKEEMAGEILAHVNAWFVAEIFIPLERDDPRTAIARMWKSVEAYFRSGRRICLVGAFALDETRDRFGGEIRQYFKRWIKALDDALFRARLNPLASKRLAEDIVVTIQGALVLARALGDDKIFERTLKALKERTEGSIRHRR
jgi:AcrR family transcriptional regulator